MIILTNKNHKFMLSIFAQFYWIGNGNLAKASFSMRSKPGWENATLPFLPSCAKLLYFVDFCVTGSVVLLLCVAAGHGRKLNQGWTLLDWLLEFIQKSGLEWELCLTSEGTLFSLRGRHSPSPLPTCSVFCTAPDDLLLWTGLDRNPNPVSAD